MKTLRAYFRFKSLKIKLIYLIVWAIVLTFFFGLLRPNQSNNNNEVPDDGNLPPIVTTNK